MKDKKRSLLRKFTLLGTAVVMIFGAFALTACNNDLTLQQQADALGQEVTQLQTNGCLTLSELDALLERLKAIEDNVQAAQGDPTALKAQLDGIRTDLEGLKIDELMARIKALEAQLSALETSNAELQAQIEALKEELEKMKGQRIEDFVLTISVENATLPKGQNFKVTIEIKNQGGADREIAFEYTYSTDGMSAAVPLFWPQIKNWNYIAESSDAMPGEANLDTIISNGTLRTTMEFGGGIVIYETGESLGHLEKGVHELRIRAKFILDWNTDNQREIEIWSNTVKLTVQ